MNIRPARTDDSPAIAQLHALSWSATYGSVLNPDYLRRTMPQERQAVWRERFASPKENQIVLIAEETDGIVAFACAFVNEHVEWGSYLDNLHVSRSHQGRGIGTSLLAEVAFFCEERCPNKGLYLSVNQANHRAQKFYLALGAHNAQSSVWSAPEGSQVPTFRFSWNSVLPLADKRLTRSSTPTAFAAGQRDR